MDLSKYYIPFEEGDFYLDELQEMVNYSINATNQNISEKDDIFDTFKSHYLHFEKQSVEKLKVLKEDFNIDVKSKEFRDNKDLMDLVADLVISLCFASSDEFFELLDEMNFTFETMCHFVDLKAFCERSQNTIVRNNLGITTGEVFFSTAVYIIRLQLELAIQKEFGLYREEYNGSRDVLEAKIQFLNLIRKVKRAQRNGEQITTDDDLTEILSGPLGSFAEGVGRGVFLKNDDGSYNLSLFSIYLFKFCRTHSPKRPTDHILFDLYDLFEVLYPCKELDAEAEKKSSAILKSTNNKYLYVKDYKRDMVRSIIGVSNFKAKKKNNKQKDNKTQ